jgi:hypothetical protein
MIDAETYSRYEQYRRERTGRFIQRTPDEELLYNLLHQYSYEYFDDFHFEKDTAASDYTDVQIANDDGEWIDASIELPEQLEYFEGYVLDTFLCKVEQLETGVCGQVNYIDYTITIAPEYMKNEEPNPHILHELIHVYEHALDMLPKFYHDILLLSLYNHMKQENGIEDIDDRILAHTHVMNGDRITRQGGNHDILFFLKSLDLDLRCGFKLGTVCGYGRDEYEQAKNERG